MAYRPDTRRRDFSSALADHSALCLNFC